MDASCQPNGKQGYRWVPYWAGNIKKSSAMNCLLCLVITVGLYFLFFHHLTVRDFWSSHEARAAMDANSILQEKRVLPKLLDGQEELQKPPLYYYLVAAISWVKGTEADAFSVRFPSAFFASVTVLLIGLCVFRSQGLMAGLLSGVVLATSMHFTWLGRIGRMDMALTFFITGGLVCAYFAITSIKPNSLYVIGIYFFFLLAVCLKGLVALALGIPILIGMPLLCAEKISSNWKSQIWHGCHKVLQIPMGLLTVVLLSSIYFFWVDWESNGEFFNVFLGYHHWVRAVGNGALRSHPFYFYFYQFPVDFLPWSPLFLLALIQSYRQGIANLCPLERFGLVWFIGMFLILSFVSYKRADYILPAYPGAALFLGAWLKKQNWIWEKISIKPALITIISIASLGWVWFVDYYLPAFEPGREMQTPAHAIREITKERIWILNTEMHALAYHCGAPVSFIAGWDLLREKVISGKIRFLVVPEKDYNYLSKNLPEFQLQAKYWRKSQKTKGLSRPFVLVEIKNKGIEQIHANAKGN